MGVRRLLIGILALGIALAGCSGPGGDPAPTSAPATSPSAQPDGEARSALAAAVSKLGEDSVRFTLDMGEAATAAGAADPASGAMQVRMRVGGPTPMPFELRTVGKGIYVKFGGNLAQQVGGGWMRVRGDDVPKALGSWSAQDPGGAQRLLQAITRVRRDGPRFLGTLNLTKSSTAAGRSLKDLGPKVGAVPFTARIDDQGRLVDLTVQMDAVTPELPPMIVRYSDFGTRVAVSKPQGRIGKIPDLLARAMDL